MNVLIFYRHISVVFITDNCCKKYVYWTLNLYTHLGTIELKFNLEGVKIYQKLENQLSCMKVILNNMDAKMVTYSILNDNVSSAVIFSTPEFIKNSIPFLHGK